MGDWNASNYRKRKAERRAKVEPSWQTNPDTGEKFLLRRVGAIAFTVAGYMPHALTGEAVEAWKEQGVKVEGDGEPVQVDPDMVQKGERNLQLMAKVVQEACVLPKLVPGATGDDELDPADLDDADLSFIFRYATGQIGNDGVPLKGGQLMNMSDLKSLRKKPGVRARTGTSG